MDFKAMTIEELEAFRDQAAGQIADLKEQFTKAGLALEKKRAETPEAKALAKMAEAQAELDALNYGEVSDG